MPKSFTKYTITNSNNNNNNKMNQCNKDFFELISP